MCDNQESSLCKFSFLISKLGKSILFNLGFSSHLIHLGLKTFKFIHLINLIQIELNLLS